MNYSSEIPPSTVIAKGDSSASNHYFPLQYLLILEEAENNDDGPEVLVQDTATLKATMKSQLPLGYAVITRTKETTVFDNLQSSLISLCQLCDNFCKIMLDKNKL